MSRIPFFVHCILLAIGLSLNSCRAAESISLYLYNTPPPLNPDTPGNLSEHLAKLLTEGSGGKYLFKVVFLPRKRLNILVAEKHWRGVVIWANPEWFNDKQQTRFLWSKPLATDHNLVVSHKLKPVEYAGPASLKGLRLGGVLGHVFPELQSMTQQGTLIREDTRDYEFNLLKLNLQRIDVTFLPVSSLAAYTQKYPTLPDWLHVAENPRNTFDYYMFCNRAEVELMSYLNGQISQLNSDAVWHDTTSAWNQKQTPVRTKPKPSARP